MGESHARLAASIDLLTSYETLSLVVGRAHPLIQGLYLALYDRHDAQVLGRQLVQARDDCKTKAVAYFNLKHPLHTNQALITNIHRLILAGFAIENDTGLTCLRAARNNNTLHLRINTQDPLNPGLCRT